MLLPAAAVASFALMAAPLQASASVSFAPSVDYRLGECPRGLSVNDLNRDGEKDVLVGDIDSCTPSDENHIVTALGTPSGTFESAQLRGRVEVGTVGTTAVGRLNDDRRKDVVVAGSTGFSSPSRISVHLGSRQGVFGEEEQAFTLGAGAGDSRGIEVALADFNHDRERDLVIANPGRDEVHVRRGRGNGRFRPTTIYAVGDAPESIEIADFDLDGELDIATANGGTHTVSVLKGKGTARFRASDEYPAPGHRALADLADTSYLDSADFNGDGRLDLAVGHRETTNVSVLLGDGTGGFADPEEYPAAEGSIADLVAGDFNLDGHPDVAVGDRHLNTAGSVGVLLGDSAGGLSAPVTSALQGHPSELATADLNNDQRPDLLALSHRSGDTVQIGELAVLLNTTTP